MSAFRWGKNPAVNLQWLMDNDWKDPYPGCLPPRYTVMALAELCGYQSKAPIVRALMASNFGEDMQVKPPRKWREFGKALGVPGLQGCDWWLAPEAFRLRCAALTKPDPPKRRWWMRWLFGWLGYGHPKATKPYPYRRKVAGGGVQIANGPPSPGAVRPSPPPEPPKPNRFEEAKR